MQTDFPVPGLTAERTSARRILQRRDRADADHILPGMPAARGFDLESLWIGVLTVGGLMSLAMAFL
jgi:hypothetical protein